MNEQERKIITLLLNEMAFEGAMKHFNEPPPDIDPAYFEQIVSIEIPKKYDANYEAYEHEQFAFPKEWGVFQCCYKCLRIIRNNIVHANKAVEPDTPERLGELLDWSARFIDAVYVTDSPLAQCAKEIKGILRIESF